MNLTQSWGNKEIHMFPKGISLKVNIIERLWFKPAYSDVKCNPHSMMAKVLDCGLEVSKFKLQLCYYIHFQTNTLGKGKYSLISL